MSEHPTRAELRKLFGSSEDKKEKSTIFSLKLNKNPYNHGGHHPPSLISLETKNVFLTHFYSRNAK
jgi:hypothetical protein